MSEMAKAAREAMKNKAKRLGTTDPHQKVDASSWTPPEPLDTEAKTGLRPLSRRAYKKGGKVEGMAAKMHAGRKPRKSGGEASMYANAKINRNVKDANEEREGEKHIGGLKQGGRTKKAIGGAFGQYLSPVLMLANALRGDKDEKKNGGRTKKEHGGGLYEGNRRVVSPTATKVIEYNKNSNYRANEKPASAQKDEGMTAEEAKKFMESRKSGGRAKKQMGGPMMGGTPPNYDPRLDMVKRQAMNFQGNPVTPGAKKGGKVEKHPDEAMDKALIKKMVKKEARTGKASGGMKRMNRKDGGMALDGELQGTRPTGGRMARKDGGRAKGKGKTDINIIISAGPKAGPGIPPGMMPPAGPPGLPPMNPQAVGAAAPVMTGPPPGPMPGPGPAMPPGMGMPRKSGGRITPKAKSFADMKAGAGSGEGRLQKTDIAEYKRGKHRAGGKVYRSSKDMDAGSGSGLGRLEKTEIQARKR